MRDKSINIEKADGGYIVRRTWREDAVDEFGRSMPDYKKHIMICTDTEMVRMNVESFFNVQDVE